MCAEYDGQLTTNVLLISIRRRFCMCHGPRYLCYFLFCVCVRLYEWKVSQLINHDMPKSRGKRSKRIASVAWERVHRQVVTVDFVRARLFS